MSNDLISTNKNSKLVLSKSKSLLDITKRILEQRNDHWIERLFQWADENRIPNYEWIEDKDHKEGGYYNGIPRDADFLLSLKSLRFYDLCIEKLPKEFFNLIQLEELKICNSNFRILSNEIKKLINLTDIYLADNNLNNLPEELKYLKKLKKIHLHSNNFNAFPEVIYMLFSLEHICIDVNQPCILSHKIQNLKNLGDLKVNNLSEIPPEIKSLTKLKLFKMSENSFGVFPIGISNLLNQETVFLYGKKSTELPDEMVNLTNLQTLFIIDFKKICLTKIPNNLRMMVFIGCDEITFELNVDNYENLKLNAFGIHNSNIEKLPSAITKIKIIEEFHLRNVKKLVLTLEQLMWIKSLKDNGLKVVVDEDLLERNLNVEINNEIPF